MCFGRVVLQLLFGCVDGNGYLDFLHLYFSAILYIVYHIKSTNGTIVILNDWIPCFLEDGVHRVFFIQKKSVVIEHMSTSLWDTDDVMLLWSVIHPRCFIYLYCKKSRLTKAVTKFGEKLKMNRIKCTLSDAVVCLYCWGMWCVYLFILSLLLCAHLDQMRKKSLEITK